MTRTPHRRARRTVGALVAGVLSATLVATGCANPDNADDADDDAGGSGGSGSTAEAGDDLFFGDLADVPEDPERIVVLWRTGSILADLGVDVVGQLDGEFLDTELEPDVYAAYADVPVVGTFEGVDVEEVIAAEPDLIIGMDHGGLGIDYDELDEIAPTVVLPIEEPTDVWANYPRVAEIVGASTTYDEQQAALEADLAAFAEEHGDVVGDLEVTSFGAMDGIWVDTSKSLTWQRLDAAGWGYNPTYTDDPERYATELALENIPDLATSDVLFYDVGLAGEVAAETQDVLDSAAFRELPAAQAGNVFPLTSGTIYTFHGAQQQLADLEAAVEAYTAS